MNELNHLQVEVMPCLLIPCFTSNSLPSFSYLQLAAGLLAFNNVRHGHADGGPPHPHEAQHNQGIRS